ncbi:MAG TPA: sigma-70 family RNA polymerase sigma factor [Thermoanaerobaculia bacterium]|nr:sigma-70 family RNA polymerase sigma factor [Thermoanaerobaculia bacterium]
MNRYPFDADYLRRLREGDPETENHFDKYFRPRLAFKWLNRGYSRSAVEDIIQETLKRVLINVRAGKIKSPESFGAYVFGISENVASENGRIVKNLDQLDLSCLDIVSTEPDGEQKFLRAERCELVRRTLKQMKPPRDAQILIAIFIEERDKDEVCAEFRITRANLRLVLCRALKRFKILYNNEKGKLPPGCGM